MPTILGAHDPNTVAKGVLAAQFLYKMPPRGQFACKLPFLGHFSIQKGPFGLKNGRNSPCSLTGGPVWVKMGVLGPFCVQNYHFPGQIGQIPHKIHIFHSKFFGGGAKNTRVLCARVWLVRERSRTQHTGFANVREPLRFANVREPSTHPPSTLQGREPPEAPRAQKLGGTIGA